MIAGKETSLGRIDGARTCVVNRLRARRPEIDEAIFARVSETTLDPVALGDPEYVAGLRVAITAAVDYVLAGLERPDKSSYPRIPAAAVTQARRAARAGVGLDTVLRRYVAGHAVLEDFVMQEADHDDLLDERTALRWMLKTSASLLDRLIPSIARAYTQELELAEASLGRRAQVSASSRRKRSSYRMGSVVDRRRSAATYEQVAQDQRARIMRALVQVVAERGFAGATVALVLAQARVSSRTFYEQFDGLEDCLVAVMDWALEQVSTLAWRELEDAESWQAGIRTVLATVLTFFDSEPELARVCIVEALAGGPVVLAHRERVIEAFRFPIVERIEREVSHVSPLTAEGVMSSVLGIMHAHIVARKPGPFIELLGPLMGLAMAPYLSARGVEREIEQGDELARAIRSGGRYCSPPTQTVVQGTGQRAALPAALNNPGARRARECLLFLAEHPDSSNREIAVGLDISHPSQISRLLAYLIRENLVAKRSKGAGKHNASRLTPHGEQIAHALSQGDV